MMGLVSGWPWLWHWMQVSLACTKFCRAGLRMLSLVGLATWAEPAPWLFCITVDAEQFGRTRDELAELLALEGIETRPFFHPLHHLPPYLNADSAALPITDRLAASGLNLPTFVGLTDGDLDHVTEVIVDAHRKGRR